MDQLALVSTYLETHIHKPLLGRTDQAQVLLDNSYGSDYTSYVYGTATVSGVTYWNYYDPLTGNLMTQLANASTARLIDGTVLAFGAQEQLLAYKIRLRLSLEHDKCCE